MRPQLYKRALRSPQRERKKSTQRTTFISSPLSIRFSHARTSLPPLFRSRVQVWLQNLYLSPPHPCTTVHARLK